MKNAMPKTKVIGLQSLMMPGNFAATRSAERITALAKSMEEHGVFSLPVIARIDDEWRPVAGHDRIAAMLRAGIKQALCIVVSGDEKALRRLSVAENLYRRHDDRAELLRLLDAEEAAVKADLPDARPVTTPRHRPVSPRGQARTNLAKAAGKSPEAIRKQEARARAKAEPPANVPKMDPPGESASPRHFIAPVDMFDVPPSQAFAERMTTMLAVLEEANALLVRAQAALAPLKTIEFGGSVYQALKTEIHTAACNVRYAKPALVCLYCRDPQGTEGRAAKCNGCRGVGYLAEHQRAAALAWAKEHGTAPAQRTLRTARELTIEVDGEAHHPSDLEPTEDTL